MITAEVEIRLYGQEGSSTHVMEFPKRNVTLMEVRAAVGELAQICHWREYRIGVGDMWTQWTSTLKN